MMLTRLAVLLALLTFETFAQDQPPMPPIVGPRGVQHGATFQGLSALPFTGSPGGVAPGAVFRIFGRGLGPAEPAVGVPPYGLRLPDAPGGTEVRVRSILTGKVAQASMLFVQEDQLAAILPRDFPLGDAEVTVWAGGMASEPVTVPVLFSFPGLFTMAQNGVGRAVIQNVGADGALEINGLTRPARPGQYVTLWATGLGDARTEDTRVFIGLESYPVEFAGPAPGVPGLDQINVRLPDDLPERGCYVRLVPAGDGLGSGPASIAITDDGDPCAHPWGISPERMAEIEAGDPATRLSLSLRGNTSALDRTQPPPSEPESSIGGQAYAMDEVLLEIQANAPARNALAYQPPFCTVSDSIYDPDLLPDLNPGDPGPPPLVVPPEQTFAGAPWVLTGPQGQTVTLASAATPGNFGLMQTEKREGGFVAPGEWTVTIPGGVEIGPTQFTLEMPALPEVSTPAALRRGEDFVIFWPAEQTTPADEVRITVAFWQPLAGAPGTFRHDSVDCVLARGATRFVIPLSTISSPLLEATEAELNFRLTRPQPGNGAEAADLIDANASIGRTWTIPLE